MTNYDDTRPEEMGTVAGYPKKLKTVDCFNAARNKPKLLIIGHARHGKDTFAELVVEKMGLSFVSSSEFVGRVAIWEQWGKERYCSFDEFFEDRVNNRAIWFNAIVAYNTPNLARTGEEMMAKHDVYVGMRNPDEFRACVDKDLFDYVIWVDGSQRHPPEGKDSNGMTADMADMLIDNNGPESNLTEAVNNLQKRLHNEGFDVNWEPMEMYTLDEPTDPHDPPVQKALEINDSKPSLEEYIGIINPPVVEEPLKCNGDCGCEDGSLCHENVCGPRSKFIVNPTLEESRKFHNDALMATCPVVARDLYKKVLDGEDKLILPPVEGTPDILKVGYQDVGTKGVEKRSNFRMLPEEEKWTDADWLESVKNLEWKDAPAGATKVLDHGFFKVLGVMGTDQAIVDAARMSYGRGTKPVNSSEGLIRYLVRNYHTSPLEMAEIKFHIRMPIFVMRQWVRHRTANLNEYSGRYSEMVRLFYVPELEQICFQSVVNKQASVGPLPPKEAELARRLIYGLSDAAFDEYENLLDMGISRETARIVLPLNTYTEVVWKLDISNLIKFLRLRDDSHAQWEIQQYAKLVSEAVKENFPMVFAAYQEVRNSHSLTEDEIYALITCNYDDLSASQANRISELRDQIL